MRKVALLNDQQHARQLSAHLTERGIHNRLDVYFDSNWDSESYGSLCCEIWVFDEDQLSIAEEVIAHWSPPFRQGITLPSSQPTTHSQRASNPLTLALLILCCTLLLGEALSEHALPSSLPQAVPQTPLVLSSINKAFLYDYPETYQLVDLFVERYSFDGFFEPSLPLEGRLLLRQIRNTPWWQGFYASLTHEGTVQGPFAEKLRQGEVWRAITPILLHGGIVHLFFNMLWLMVLGGQLEAHIGSLRYLLFIAIAAIFSNTAQYAMSGPNFLGFSGVLSAMAAFIWWRQRYLPWEGYLIHPSNFTLFFISILGMAALQLAAFIAEVTADYSFSLGIANSAHLSGAAIGYLLAHGSFFKAQRQISKKPRAKNPSL